VLGLTRCGGDEILIKRYTDASLCRLPAPDPGVLIPLQTTASFGLGEPVIASNAFDGLPTSQLRTLKTATPFVAGVPSSDGRRLTTFSGANGIDTLRLYSRSGDGLRLLSCVAR
jgi:hypothetical protein